MKNLWQSVFGIFKKRWLKILGLCLASIFLFWCIFLNYTEITEVGVARNLVSGEMRLQAGGGLYITAPWTLVACIDIRPMRVAVTSAGHGYSAKLIQFDSDYWREFVATEGFYYYWWANRVSFNFGYDEEYRGMKDLLRGYAYAAKRYPFVKILNEYEHQVD